MTPEHLREAVSARGHEVVAVPQVAHVGYHRTGTNLLQDRVFPQLAAQVFCPSQSGWQFFDDLGGFDLDGARSHYAAEQQRNPEGRLFLISAERLTGTFETDDLTVADKLHRLNPDMRIIMVLRAQPDMFRSLYHLHVKRGGRLVYRDFVGHLVTRRRCDYAAMVERYHDAFAPDRVLVLLYEELTAQPKRFVETICGFLGVEAPAQPAVSRPVNARRTDAALRAGRWTNSVLGIQGTARSWKHDLRDLGERTAGHLDRLNRRLRKHPLAAIDADAALPLIRSAYADGNRKLADKIGKPLADHGYPV